MELETGDWRLEMEMEKMKARRRPGDSQETTRETPRGLRVAREKKKKKKKDTK